MVLLSGLTGLKPPAPLEPPAPPLGPAGLLPAVKRALAGCAWKATRDLSRLFTAACSTYLRNNICAVCRATTYNLLPAHHRSVRHETGYAA